MSTDNLAICSDNSSMSTDNLSMSTDYFGHIYWQFVHVHWQFSHINWQFGHIYWQFDHVYWQFGLSTDILVNPPTNWSRMDMNSSILLFLKFQKGQRRSFLSGEYKLLLPNKYIFHWKAIYLSGQELHTINELPLQSITYHYNEWIIISFLQPWSFLSCFVVLWSWRQSTLITTVNLLAIWINRSSSVFVLWKIIWSVVS